MFLLALALAAAMPSPVTGSLPAGPAARAAAESMFAQVWVNGVDTGLVVEFTANGSELSASGDDLRAIGIDVAAGSAPVALRRIPGLTFQTDPATQTVRIAVPTATMQRTEVASQRGEVTDLRPEWGGLLNYSVYAEDGGTGGATGEVRLFGPAGTLSTGILARRFPGGSGFSAYRLDTRYVFEDPATARRFTVGDFISTDGSASGAIRAAGLQVSTDFTLQPDLITTPMPRLTGGDGVPSTVDLYVDGVRRLSQNVGAGRFAVSNVPMVDGAGRISLLVRDALGHESVQQISFYGARDLLRPGLTAGSLQVGRLRVRAFERGDRYGAAFASGTVRRGLNDRLTGEARVSLAQSVQVAGIGTAAKIGEIAVVSASGDVSHSEYGNGAALGVAVRRDGRRASAFFIGEGTIGKFATLADRRDSLNGWRLQAGGSLQADGYGSLALSGTMLRSDGIRSRILAASWSRPIGPRISTFVNLIETRIGRSEVLATAGLTIALSARSAASVQAGHDNNGASGTASWSRSTLGDRGVSLRSAVSSAPGQTRLLGGATVRGAQGEVGADIQLDRRGAAARVFASGAAIWIGGRPELTANVGQSFAIVQTGQPGVAVALENRAAGRTRRDGSLFLPNLPPNAPARITLDYDGIDLDHEAVSTEAMIRTRRGGGAIVRLPVRLLRTATVRVVSASGTPLRLGAIVRRPDGREDVIGYDGVAYLTDIADTVEAEVQDGETTCHIRFLRGTDDPVVCQPH